MGAINAAFSGLHRGELKPKGEQQALWDFRRLLYSNARRHLPLFDPKKHTATGDPDSEVSDTTHP